MKIVIFKFVLLSLILISKKTKAQDTLKYYEEEAAMYSNSYFLYPKTKTFEHRFSTDDCQLWYGKGTYEIKNSALTLNFKDSDKRKLDEIKFIYSSKKLDSINVSVLNQNFELMLFNCSANGERLNFSLFKNHLNISRKGLKENDILEIEISPLEKIKIQLSMIDSLEKIIIINHQSELGKIHYESNFQRKMTIKSNYLLSEDYYRTSKRKTVKFLKK